MELNLEVVLWPNSDRELEWNGQGLVLDLVDSHCAVPPLPFWWRAVKYFPHIPALLTVQFAF